MRKNPLLSDKKALRAALRERVSATYAHYLADGQRAPGRALALQLEAELGIPVGWWDTRHNEAETVNHNSPAEIKGAENDPR